MRKTRLRGISLILILLMVISTCRWPQAMSFVKADETPPPLDITINESVGVGDGMGSSENEPTKDENNQRTEESTETSKDAHTSKEETDPTTQDKSNTTNEKASSSQSIDENFYDSEITRVSMDTDGLQWPWSHSYVGDISSDGRYVVYDHNDNIYRYDAAENATILINALDDGSPAGSSRNPVVSNYGDVAYYTSSYSAENITKEELDYDTVLLYDHETQNQIITQLTPDSSMANGDAEYADISDDGNYVVYTSEATNLLSEAGGNYDIFRYNRFSESETVEIVSTPANSDYDNEQPSLSGDGHHVAFITTSNRTNNGKYEHKQLFVQDMDGEIEHISQSASGAPADGDVTSASISQTGRYVVFAANANNLSGDQNDYRKIYFYDRETKKMEMVSVNFIGGAPDGNSNSPTVSADGRYIAFHSSATDLVLKDSNDERDVFVYDRKEQTTKMLSRSASGKEGNGASLHPKITADGKYVAFQSRADSLTSFDTNDRIDVFVSKVNRTFYDNEPPSWSMDGGLELEDKTNKTVTFSWSKAEDNQSYIGYLIYQNGVLVDKMDSHHRYYTAEGLTPGETYHFEVKPTDAFQVGEGKSSSFTIPEPNEYGKPPTATAGGNQLRLHFPKAIPYHPEQLLLGGSVLVNSQPISVKASDIQVGVNHNYMTLNLPSNVDPHDTITLSYQLSEDPSKWAAYEDGSIIGEYTDLYVNVQDEMPPLLVLEDGQSLLYRFNRSIENDNYKNLVRNGVIRADGEPLEVATSDMRSSPYVTAELAKPISPNQEITVSYTSAGSEESKIFYINGNELESFTDLHAFHEGNPNPEIAAEENHVYFRLPKSMETKTLDAFYKGVEIKADNEVLSVEEWEYDDENQEVKAILSSPISTNDELTASYAVPPETEVRAKYYYSSIVLPFNDLPVINYTTGTNDSGGGDDGTTPPALENLEVHVDETVNLTHQNTMITDLEIYLDETIETVTDLSSSIFGDLDIKVEETIHTVDDVSGQVLEDIDLQVEETIHTTQNETIFTNLDIHIEERIHTVDDVSSRVLEDIDLHVDETIQTIENHMVDTFSQLVTELIPEEKLSMENTIESGDEKVNIRIPANTLRDPTTVNVEIIKETESYPPDDFIQVGFDLYDITMEDINGNDINQFDRDLSIDFDFDSSTLPTEITSDHLQVYYWEEDSQQWKDVPTEIDEEKEIVTGLVDHLTIFTVLAKPDDKQQETDPKEDTGDEQQGKDSEDKDEERDSSGDPPESSQEEDLSEKVRDEEDLPETSTSIYNYLLMGAILFTLGFVLLIYYYRKPTRKERRK